MRLKELLEEKQLVPNKCDFTLQEAFEEGMAADAAHKLGLVSKTRTVGVDKGGIVKTEALNAFGECEECGCEEDMCECGDEEFEL